MTRHRKHRAASGRRSRLVLRPFAAVLLVLSLFCAGCEKPKQEEAKLTAALQPVSICRSSVMHQLLLVAEDQGYFTAQGLTVTTKEFVVGREALESMLKGECDFATAAEPPVVDFALQRGDFRILSALITSDNLSCLAARADRGIATPADLRGKRIATVKGTAPHYFLTLFLERHGIDLKEVSVDFQKGDAVLPAITSGQVDAIAMTTRVANQARQALGANGVLMEEPGLYRNFYSLLTTNSLLEKRPGLALQLLKALAQAEELIQENPGKAQAIISASLQIPPAEAEKAMGMFEQHLSLDHAMLIGMEDIARWYIQQSDNPNRPLPNMLRLIDTSPLRAVRPKAVGLTR